MEVSQSVEVTPMGTVEFSFQWKAGNARNLTDLFFMVSFPIKHFAGKKILVDQQAVPVSSSAASSGSLRSFSRSPISP
ncbi:MAG: hypothetical protein IKA76_02380 [Clostridia bacterium]|nr:hypothetical protein [Clostridia bacterium]